MGCIFLYPSMFDKEITIYGDGKQVRDVLYIDDLIDAYWLSYKNRKKLKGKFLISTVGHKTRSVY
jgi:CDP-paratose 2-epimerase